MKKHTCPCCKKNKTSKFLVSKKFPYFTTPIKDISKKKIKKKNYLKYFDDLKYSFCKICDHVFLIKSPNFKIIDELYKKFYSYPSAMSGDFLPTRDDAFLNFLKKYLGKNKKKDCSFFEIGCYDGYILYQLKKQGFKNVAGCDPSVGARIAIRHGLNVKNEFFNVSKIKDKYDFIIARHLVEHLDNPLQFLKSLENIINENTKIIIEVPNGEFYLKKGLVEVFSHQHIHLFNKFSMQSLVKDTNFGIEKIKQEGANIYFILSKKKDINKIKKIPLVKRFLKKYHHNLKKIKLILKFYKDKQIIFYGAGGFCCAAIHLYKIDKKIIHRILDSDKNKINKEFLHIDKKIQRNDINLNSDNLAIITSYYADDILKLIKKKNISKNIMLIHPEIKLKRLK